jgi:hypothetical protein
MRYPAVAVLIGWAVLLPASDLTKFQTTLSLVKADIEVSDRKTGAPIPDLQASDFVVRDEDQPREIAYFGNESGPLDLLFLVDVSGSVRDMLPEIASSARDALRALGAGDRAAVMAFSRTTLVTQEWTDDFAAAARGIRGALEARIGLDTDINQALWAAADYLHQTNGTSRRAILILTDNMQETHVPDALVDEQLAQAGAVLDGFLVRWPIPMPPVTHPGILGFARNTGGEVIEGMHPAARLAEMIRRIKARYSIHFRPVETTSAQPRRIHVELSEDARRRFPHARVRARRIYFPMGTYRPKTEIPAGHKMARRQRPVPGCGETPGVRTVSVRCT